MLSWFLSCLLAEPCLVRAQSSTTTSIAGSLTAVPSNTRATYGDLSQTVSLSSTSGSGSVSLGTSNSTTSDFLSSTRASSTQTFLVGSNTRQTTAPSGTFACNGYAELCKRKFSNVTYAVAHNSPFHVQNNVASNQVYDVTRQLNDGIRGLQSETHYLNETVMLCHTSCDELNAGTLQDYLVTVREWLESTDNRLEVISILLGNEDYIDPNNYTAPFENAGLLPYVYTPASQPMDIDGWPTLSDMILTNQRVVVMLEYDANQTAVPWLLDMWSYQWQTPFSPTNQSFPCTVQRPPGLDSSTAQNRLYLANHNLNTEIDLSSLGAGDILIPDTVALDNTNANTTGEGTAATMVQQCTEQWGRPPNYLLVDYYNYGNFNGSVLAVAAEANNVTYNVDSCCGKAVTSSASVQQATRNWLPLSLPVLMHLLMI